MTHCCGDARATTGRLHKALFRGFRGSLPLATLRAHQRIPRRDPAQDRRRPELDARRLRPGTEEEIKSFCSTNYDVTFPLFAKIVVKGEGEHPLYAELTSKRPEARALPGTDFRA